MGKSVSRNVEKGVAKTSLYRFFWPLEKKVIADNSIAQKHRDCLAKRKNLHPYGVTPKHSKKAKHVDLPRREDTLSAMIAQIG